MFKKNKKISKILAATALFAVLFIFFTPVLAEADSHLGNIIPCEGDDCGVCDIFRLISNIVKFAAFTIAAPLAGIIMAYGGFKLITAGGNESERSKGTNAIWAAVWGILITFGAYVIVNSIIGGLAGESFSNSWYQFPGCVSEGVMG